MSEITTDGDVQVKFRHNGQSGVTSLGLLKISKHGIRYSLSRGLLQKLIFRKRVTFHSFFAAVRRRARRARSSRNASVSTRSGGSRRSWSASRTSRRRARRERTSGRTSATRQDRRPTAVAYVAQKQFTHLSIKAICR